MKCRNTILFTLLTALCAVLFVVDIAVGSVSIPLSDVISALKRKMADMMLSAAVLLVFCALLFESNGFGGWIPESSCRNIIGFTLGISTATLVLNVLYLFGILDKVREKKLSLIKKK